MSQAALQVPRTPEHGYNYNRVDFVKSTCTFSLSDDTERLTS